MNLEVICNPEKSLQQVLPEGTKLKLSPGVSLLVGDNGRGKTAFVRMLKSSTGKFKRCDRFKRFEKFRFISFSEPENLEPFSFFSFSSLQEAEDFVIAHTDFGTTSYNVNLHLYDSFEIKHSDKSSYHKSITDFLSPGNSQFEKLTGFLEESLGEHYDETLMQDLAFKFSHDTIYYANGQKNEGPTKEKKTYELSVAQKILEKLNKCEKNLIQFIQANFSSYSYKYWNVSNPKLTISDVYKKGLAWRTNPPTEALIMLDEPTIFMDYSKKKQFRKNLIDLTEKYPNAYILITTNESFLIDNPYKHWNYLDFNEAPVKVKKKREEVNL